jgi:molecular chaperone GrpE
MPDDAPTPAPAEAPPTPPPETPAKEDWETRFKYLFADFENFRRRSAKERESATRQARGAMLRELLPLAEAFRSAAMAAGQLPSTDPLRQGFELLEREWSTFLRHEGVEPVAEVGRPFQAEEAEAVGEAPAGSASPDGTVAEVVQQGYRFFGGLLRPAKVIVARAPSGGSAAEEGSRSDDAPPEAES